MSGIGRGDFGPFLGRASVLELGAWVGHGVPREAACVSRGELAPGQDAASRRPERMRFPGLSREAGRVGCSFFTNTDLHVRWEPPHHSFSHLPSLLLLMLETTGIQVLDVASSFGKPSQCPITD